MKKLDTLKRKKEKLEEELKQLEETDILKIYKELQRSKKEVEKKIYEYHRKIEFKKYDKCDHIYVMIKRKGEQQIRRIYLPKICIKCGLDESTKSGLYKYLSLEEKIMKDYLIKHPILNRNCIYVFCEPDLAKLIYLKLKENNLAQDDDMLIKNFISIVKNLKEENDLEVDNQIKLLLKPEVK